MGTGGRGTPPGPDVRAAAERRGRLRLRRRTRPGAGKARRTPSAKGAKSPPKAVADFRRILDDKAVDVVRRRRLQPLARPGRHPRLRRRQARLRREAVQPQPARGRAAGRGRPQARPPRADGQPAAELAEDHRGDRAAPRRASSAGCTSPRRGTRTTARRSARARRRTRRRGSTTTCGRARPRGGRSAPTTCTTTGTGSGTGATASSGNNGVHMIDLLPLGPGRRLPDARHLRRRPLPLRGRPGDARHARRQLRLRGGKTITWEGFSCNQIPRAKPIDVLFHGENGQPGDRRQRLHGLRPEGQGGRRRRPARAATTAALRQLPRRGPRRRRS